jgi:hypothetical protein
LTHNVRNFEQCSGLMLSSLWVVCTWFEVLMIKTLDSCCSTMWGFARKQKILQDHNVHTMLTNIFIKMNSPLLKPLTLWCISCILLWFMPLLSIIFSMFVHSQLLWFMAWDPRGDIHLCTLQEGCFVTTLLTIGSRNDVCILWFEGMKWQND